MCGISGIVYKNNNSVEPSVIEGMTDLIKHRGPDGYGYYHGENFAFGHRRLAIVDLSEAGHQPMIYQDRYVITYNGEVYNHIEIRQELEALGHCFHSHTDTEVILAAYAQWGQECVQKFNGMWAFAIYDQERNIIFCSRDRFGVKPFYYYESDDKFVFGSEIKQCLGSLPANKINTPILMDFIVAGFAEHSDETFFQDIKKLPASHNMVYDLKCHKYTITQYFDITKQLFESESEEILINGYQKALESGIDLRLRSDVKVGTCLSGGMDSSTVAAIAARKYQGENRFMAIHAQSIEPSSDESPYAKMVAQHCDLDLNIVKPTADDFIAMMDDVIYTQEEPFAGPSIFMQYAVMQKAKSLGCTVMLDGQGGDETLLGYEKYYPSAYIDVYRKHGLKAALQAVKDSNKNNTKMSWKWIVKYWVGGLSARLRERFYWKKASFVKPQYRQSLDFLRQLAKRYNNVFELQKYEINRTNLPILLRYEDKNSMRHSIEARLPFVDYQTLQCGLSLPSALKIKEGWTKYVLRRIAENYLPSQVVWRKNKLGFNAPDKTWLDSYRNEMLEEIKSSKLLAEICNMDQLTSSYLKMDLKLQWRLFNVARWERLYQVEIA